jgi:16S rRNA (cytosine967-C5)-methyltransferase
VSGSSPGLPARQVAARLLSGVLDDRLPLDAQLEANGSPLDGLPPADRALARAIVGAALRRHGQIEVILGELIERALPRRSGHLRRILEIAAAQLLFMDVPDHAAVSTAMALADADSEAHHFKPLLNGVLRNLARRRDELLAAHSVAKLNVPDWLWQRWVAAYGEAVAAEIAAAHLAEPPLDLSVKADAETWAERLGGRVLTTGTVRCRAKGRIEDLPGFAEGAWWVQDAAAALPARLLGEVAGKHVLDLCAAPGGKTAQLAAAGAVVTAVDISPARIDRLRTNLARLRLEAACIAADALSFDPGETFDAVLLDAPCSATGTIRRHPDIPWLKRDSDIAALADLQRRLLAKAGSLAHPDGTIVFATCSLEPEEGEALAAAIPGELALTPQPIAAGDVPGLSPRWLTNGWLRTLPCYRPDSGVGDGMDGFFAGRFVKG